MNVVEKVISGNGMEIIKGVIVGFKESETNTLTNGEQGRVIVPHSTFIDNEFTVPVYIPKEREEYLYPRHQRYCNEWKEKFQKQRESGEFDFLFEEDNWRYCPYVVFFKPEDIIVENFWSSETLTEKYFSNSWHSIYKPSNLEENPSLYRCFFTNCTNTAKVVFLYNFWGSVFILYICEDCQQNKFEGNFAVMGETVPEMKNPFLYIDGTPVED